MRTFGVSMMLAWRSCWTYSRVVVIWDAMVLMWRHCYNGVSCRFTESPKWYFGPVSVCICAWVWLCVFFAINVHYTYHHVPRHHPAKCLYAIPLWCVMEWLDPWPWSHVWDNLRSYNVVSCQYGVIVTWRSLVILGVPENKNHFVLTWVSWK